MDVCEDCCFCSLGQLCRLLSASLNLHSAPPLWHNSMLYIYKMYDKRAWPLSVIGCSFSCPIGTFPQLLRLASRISKKKNIISQAIIVTEWACCLCLLCLRKSHRPEFRSTDSDTCLQRTAVLKQLWNEIRCCRCPNGLWALITLKISE